MGGDLRVRTCTEGYANVASGRDGGLPDGVCTVNALQHLGYGIYFAPLSFILTRFLPNSLSHPARTVMYHLFWAMISATSC